MKKVNKHFGMHITAACFKQSGQHMLKQERRQIWSAPPSQESVSNRGILRTIQVWK